MPHQFLRSFFCSNVFLFLLFTQASDPLFCDSVTQCDPCPDGMICEFQQKLEEAILNPGFYRLDASSLNVVACPNPTTQCTGSENATFGDGLCAEGHEGKHIAMFKVSTQKPIK